jgi:hypothetical protein
VKDTPSDPDRKIPLFAPRANRSTKALAQELKDSHPVPAEALSRNLVSELATRHNLPQEEVGRIYDKQVKALTGSAKLETYLQILAAQHTSRLLAQE